MGIERKLQSIRVRTARGGEVVVHVFQEFADAREPGDVGERWMPGRKRYALPDGQDVQAISESAFIVTGTGEVLTL
jgi:hypothetical protein